VAGTDDRVRLMTGGSRKRRTIAHIPDDHEEEPLCASYRDPQHQIPDVGEWRTCTYPVGWLSADRLCSYCAEAAELEEKYD
jgi:hypothetical protein